MRRVAAAAKWGLLALLDAVVVYWSVLFAWDGRWLFLAMTAGGALLLNVLLFRRAYPFRYLAPGLLFLGLMVVYPMGYTVYVSFTNYATGNLLPKREVIRLLTEGEKGEIVPDPPRRFPFTGYGTPGSLYALYLRGEEGDYVLFPDGRLSSPQNHRIVSADGVPESIDGYPQLLGRDLFPMVAQLQGLRIPYGEGWLRLATLREFGLYLPRYRYDPRSDTLTDLATGKVYTPREGRFVAPDGEALDPGWVESVGLANYIRFFRDPLYHGAFVRVFLWNVAWAVLSVAFSFALGLALAVLLNDRSLRLRKLYRSLLIVPYALPAFISVLIWRAFFNQELGLFNQTLFSWFGVKVPWLQDVFWARFSIILTNVWLTYPYMMLVSLGALQSIPGELYEAAKVDGAGSWRRFTHVTFPLLMVSVSPLLIGSFAFTFNNFTLIWLLTRGEPVVEIGSRAGATDILLSYAYRLAFEGARGNEWSMASALAVLIFLIVILVSGVSFARTRALEEVSRGL